MALFKLEDVVQPLTRQDVQTSIYRVFAQVGISTTAWGSGAVVRTMTVAVSVTIAAWTQVQARIAAAGFVELSAKKWLRLAAYHLFGVEWIEATYASGYVQLVNSGGGVFSLDAGDLIVTCTRTGKTYRSTEGFELGVLGTVSVAVTAIEAGSASNAAPGELAQVVTPPMLNVTCSNSAALVGSDDETDASLKLRCKEKLGSLSPMGPWDAYAFAARSSSRIVAGGAPATTGITRTRVRRDGYGNLQLIVANNSGPVTGTVGDTSTDLGAIDDAIQRGAAPLGTNASTVSAQAVGVTPRYKAYCYSTARRTSDEVKTLVNAALLEFFRTQPIGGNTLDPSDVVGFIYADALRACIANALPGEIFHVELIDPSGDIALTANQVAVFATASASSEVQFVTRPEGSVAA